jgi:WD40 repeat protein
MQLDISLSASIDVNKSKQVIALVSGKLVYLVELSSSRVIGKLGRENGGLHKENITCVKFDQSGKYIATCDSVGRAVVWDFQTQRSEKILDGHTGSVYKVAFNEDAETLFTCSEDGRVLIWDWKIAKITGSFIRHKSATRAFDVNWHMNPSRIVCGQTDGEISSWDLSEKAVIDTIAGEPEDKPKDPTLNHSGAITCLKISPNNQYLATGSSDNTIKFWNISSYSKGFAEVQREEQESVESMNKLERPIDILDESYDIQLENNDYFALKAGQVSFPLGYHADLLYSLNHESTVVDLKFSDDSNILVSCSLDCTIKLWSVKRGTLLFQINAPSPVTSIFIDASDKIFAACQNRLLVFGIVAHSKESDLHPAWKTKTPTVAEHEENMNIKRRSLVSATRVSTADYDSEREGGLDVVGSPNQMSRAQSGNNADNNTNQLLVPKSAISNTSRNSMVSGQRTPVVLISQSQTSLTPENPDRFISPVTVSGPSTASGSRPQSEEDRYTLQRQKSAEIRKIMSATSVDQPSLFLETMLAEGDFDGLDKRMLAMNLARYGVDDQMVLDLISSNEYMMKGILLDV